MKSKSDLIQYLSSKTGIPVYNEIKITLNENYARNNRVQIVCSGVLYLLKTFLKIHSYPICLPWLCSLSF